MNLLRLGSCAALLTVAAVVLTACSSGDDASSEPAGAQPEVALVNVPVIEGDVAIDKFCDLYKQVHCAAAVGCCKEADRKPATFEACEAATDCPVPVSHPLLEGGKIHYDAAAAGDFLRASAKDASHCDGSSRGKRPGYLTGTLAAGEDCTPKDGDYLYTRLCGAGLDCELKTDQTGAQTGSCVEAVAAPAGKAEGEACADGSDCESGRCDLGSGQCAARLAEGKACVSDDDCLSDRCTDGKDEPDCSAGGCTCASSANGFCSDKLAPPSNATITTPTKLCVQANHESNSGTNSSVSLQYAYNGGWWGCDISRISSGNTECCTPTKYGSNFDTKRWFFVELKSEPNDGLRVGGVIVYGNEGSETIGQFDIAATISSMGNVKTSLSCTGCNSNYNNCSTCWVDGDGGDYHHSGMAVALSGNSNGVEYTYGYN